MKLLLDTHLLLWAALNPSAIPAKAAEAMQDTGNDLSFSVVSVWEVVIKLGTGRSDFEINPFDFRRNLLASGYRELEVTAAHVLGVRDLPSIHGDPFDRLLLAQSRVEGLIFLTADATIARYPSNVMKV